VSDSDLLARGLAIAALALTLFQMITSARRGRWARRYRTSVEMRPMIKSLQEVLDGAHDQTRVDGLWTTTTSASLASLVETARGVPDKRLLAAARSAQDEVMTLRGLSWPTESDQQSSTIALTAAQLAHLETARTSLARVRDIVDEARRKGAT
jgi:hypothetical protein